MARISAVQLNIVRSGIKPDLQGSLLLQTVTCFNVLPII